MAQTLPQAILWGAGCGAVSPERPAEIMEAAGESGKRNGALQTTTDVGPAPMLDTLVEIHRNLRAWSEAPGPKRGAVEI